MILHELMQWMADTPWSVGLHDRMDPFWMRVVGATSILLWSTVGWGGRWIGFS